MYSTSSPQLLATALSPHEPVRKWGMTVLRQVHAAVWAAKKYIADKADSPDSVSKTLEEMLRDAWFLQTQIGLEALQVCVDAGFEPNDRQVLLLAHQLWGGPNQTKFTAEDVFGHLSHVTQRSAKGGHQMNKHLA